MFEILVNGTPRSYRDVESVAIDAGRVLKVRDKSEITVVNTTTGKWAAISDAQPVWKDAPALSVISPSA
jgi:hypothetical protein